MKLWREIKQDFLNDFEESLGNQEAMSIFYLIVEYFTQQYRPVLNDLPLMSKEEYNQFQEICKELNNQKPIQYILGYAWFYDMQLYVNKHVLIPRQETEELVSWILSDIKNKTVRIVDIGTGSGAIAIALAKYSKGSVIAIDIDESTLQVATNNAIAQQVDIDFYCEDIMQWQPNQVFDVIVSNPPYIPISYASQMSTQVVDFEPSKALFVPDNQPILFYERIIDFAVDSLAKHGSLYFEMNEFYKEEVETYAIQKGFTVESRKDLNGNWRMIKCLF